MGRNQESRLGAAGLKVLATGSGHRSSRSWWLIVGHIPVLSFPPLPPVSHDAAMGGKCWCDEQPKGKCTLATVGAIASPPNSLLPIAAGDGNWQHSVRAGTGGKHLPLGGVRRGTRLKKGPGLLGCNPNATLSANCTRYVCQRHGAGAQGITNWRQLATNSRSCVTSGGLALVKGC